MTELLDLLAHGGEIAPLRDRERLQMVQRRLARG